MNILEQVIKNYENGQKIINGETVPQKFLYDCIVQMTLKVNELDKKIIKMEKTIANLKIKNNKLQEQIDKMENHNKENFDIWEIDEY